MRKRSAEGSSTAQLCLFQANVIPRMAWAASVAYRSDREEFLEAGSSGSETEEFVQPSPARTRLQISRGGFFYHTEHDTLNRESVVTRKQVLFFSTDLKIF